MKTPRLFQVGRFGFGRILRLSLVTECPLTGASGELIAGWSRKSAVAVVATARGAVFGWSASYSTRTASMMLFSKSCLTLTSSSSFYGLFSS
jgi:hypothetical protein